MTQDGPTRREFLQAGPAVLAAAAWPASGRGGGGMIRGPLFNEDDSNFFVTHHPDQISAEAIDVWVDALAEAGVGTLLTCPGAMTCNYATKVWETRWSRYDPAGPDDQPVLRYRVPA